MASKCHVAKRTFDWRIAGVNVAVFVQLLFCYERFITVIAFVRLHGHVPLHMQRHVFSPDKNKNKESTLFLLQHHHKMLHCAFQRCNHLSDVENDELNIRHMNLTLFNLTYT